jgi:ethanolamine utilization microcompartment shell protein EutL
MKPLFYRKPLGKNSQALVVRCFADFTGNTKSEAVLTIITGSDPKGVRADVDKYVAALNKAASDFYEGKL